MNDPHSNGRCKKQLRVTVPKAKEYTIFVHRIYGEENFWPCANYDCNGLSVAARKFAEEYQPTEEMEILVGYNVGHGDGIARYLIEPVVQPTHTITKI